MPHGLSTTATDTRKSARQGWGHVYSMRPLILKVRWILFSLCNNHLQIFVFLSEGCNVALPFLNPGVWYQPEYTSVAFHMFSHLHPCRKTGHSKRHPRALRVLSPSPFFYVMCALRNHKLKCMFFVI